MTSRPSCSCNSLQGVWFFTYLTRILGSSSYEGYVTLSPHLSVSCLQAKSYDKGMEGFDQPSRALTYRYWRFSLATAGMTQIMPCRSAAIRGRDIRFTTSQGQSYQSLISGFMWDQLPNPIVFISPRAQPHLLVSSSILPVALHMPHRSITHVIM